VTLRSPGARTSCACICCRLTSLCSRPVICPWEKKKNPPKPPVGRLPTTSWLCTPPQLVIIIRDPGTHAFRQPCPLLTCDINRGPLYTHTAANQRAADLSRPPQRPFIARSNCAASAPLLQHLMNAPTSWKTRPLSVTRKRLTRSPLALGVLPICTRLRLVGAHTDTPPLPEGKPKKCQHRVWPLGGGINGGALLAPVDRDLSLRPATFRVQKLLSSLADRFKRPLRPSQPGIHSTALTGKAAINAPPPQTDLRRAPCPNRACNCANCSSISLLEHIRSCALNQGPGLRVGSIHPPPATRGYKRILQLRATIILPVLPMPAESLLGEDGSSLPAVRTDTRK